jgi:hypothetical protein
MAYGQNDPATDRRISRLSLISSAANFYAGKTADPAVPLATAQEWEAWVYEGMPAAPSNGAYTPAPASVPMCAECNAALTPVNFKKGNSWPVEQLASQSLSKFGKVLCKTHYFGRKT